MQNAMVTWRPGSAGSCELKAAILHGQGGSINKVIIESRSPFEGNVTQEVQLGVLDNELAQDPKLFKELAAANPHGFLHDMHSRLRELQKIKQAIEEVRPPRRQNHEDILHDATRASSSACEG